VVISSDMLASEMPSAIDWTRPWYASIQAIAEQVTGHADWLTRLNQLSAALGLTNHLGVPINFVAQSVLPKGMAYEAFISQTGQVPTRDNLHDFFNALVWLAFPGIKRQLNALQAAQIETRGVGQSRGQTRDAATIFDENCALLVVSDTPQGHALLQALRDHCWQRAFIEQRACFGSYAEVWLFGHAAMEKLVTPYKSITAHAWPVMVPADFFAMQRSDQRQRLDTQVACELQQRGLAGLTTRYFSPLPLLGVPGWWQAQNEEFYADITVFRPKTR
jgi:hypothetical protein